MSLEDLSDPSGPSAPVAENRRKRGRRFRRRWLLIVPAVLVLLLVVGLLLMAGPGFRVIAPFAASKWAETQGLVSRAEVEGSLFSGFTIRNVSLAPADPANPKPGATGIVSLELGEASLSYDLGGLIRDPAGLGWLEKVHLESLALVLHLPEAEESKKGPAEKSAPSPKTPTFSPIWNLLEADISIADVSVEIAQGGKTTEVAGFRLSSRPDIEGVIALDSFSIPGSDPFTDFSVPIRKGERSVTLGPIDLPPAGTIREVTVSEPQPTVFTFGLAAVVAGGELRVAFDENQIIEASLARNTRIDLAEIFPERGDELPLRGTITDFGFRFANALAPPSEWEIAANLVGNDIGWKDLTFDTLALVLRDGNASLDLLRPGAEVSARVNVPLGQATSTEALASLPANASARLSAPELGILLREFGTDLPLEGGIAVDATDLRFDFAGNLAKGSVKLRGDTLAYDGLSVPLLSLDAEIAAPNTVETTLSAALESGSRVTAKGSFLRDDLSYSATAGVEVGLAGALGEWLRERFELNLEGNATLAWKGSGNLESPSHSGEATLAVDDLIFDGKPSIAVDLAASYDGTNVVVSGLQASAGALSLSANGGWDGTTVSIPEATISHDDADRARLTLSLPFDPTSEGRFLGQDTPVSVDLAFDRFGIDRVLALAVEEPPIAGELDGSLSLSGNFRALEAGGKLTFSPQATTIGEEATVGLDLAFAGDAAVPSSWDLSLDADVGGLVFREKALETVELSIRSDRGDGRSLVNGTLAFSHAGTSLDARVRADLTETGSFEDFAKLAIDADADLAVESIAALLRDFAPPEVAGFPVDGNVIADLDRFRLQNGSLVGGTALVASESLAVEGQSFETVRIEAEVDRPDHLAAAIGVALDEKTRTAANLSYHLKDQTYEGDLSLAADLRGEGKLKTLLSGRNLAKLLPGTTELAWKGSGDIDEKIHRGELDLDAKTLALADGAVPLDIAIAGSYREDAADFPAFAIRSGVLDLDGSLLWKDGRLQLIEWRGISEGTQVLSLDASVPFPPDALGPQWLELAEAMEVDLDVSALPVATILRLAKKDPPIRGNLDIDLGLGGTPSAPTVAGKIELGSIALLRPEGDMPLGLALLELNASGDQASVSGRYDHPDLNPLTIDASLPFHPLDWAKGNRKFIDEPVVVSAKMADSSLGFLAAQFPEIESITGTVGIDAALKGSISAPQIAGRGVLEVSQLRLGSRDAPSIYDVGLSTRFAENRLVIERLNAIVAGGELSGSGNVQFVPGGEPRFDIRVAGREMLVYRDPDTNVRTDADLSLTGPFSKVRLAGEIGIVDSRWFKNFDLLPRSLPSFSTSTSALPTVDRGPVGGGAAYTDLDLGVKQSPFSDWTADVRIHTKTPFQVRSNLVESDLVADIRVGGTLGKPVPVGFLAIDEGEMSLPFSSIEVETGRVEFDENTGFNGALEFKARAKADKYRITAYVYNRVLDPKYVLTSVPPMPTEDLITLIITGTARDDLIGGDVGTLAAGKAATLLFKNMRKASAAADKEPSLLDDLQERTELEIGGVNPETGEQTVGGKIRLWKQLFFVGDVDARNDYRAVLKYVFRFR